MADTRVCPYHSLFATRYSLPFLPVASRYLPVAVVYPSVALR
ncbi:MAG: hypothetical protein RRB24_05245 [Armatimonadota bacterium]|nr:hypothetical protein [Armatimonadota bacterium]MDT7972216.1 hypothetical protein [Armatimonadota bacterium]